MEPERLILYSISALLVGCIAIGYVRARTWKVFFVAALTGVIVFGALMGHLVGGDHPGLTVGPMFLFMAIAALGVILGFLWTLTSPMRIKILRRFRSDDSLQKMQDFPEDIYTEPEPDVDTLANLGPLTGMAGIWTSAKGLDTSPKPDGPEKQVYIEHVELQPIDAQANGPQLFYGLRYHTRIVKPDEVETFHDQVGYWLWEPATGAVILTLAIPRGQTAMAVGRAAPDAKSFRLEAVRGSETNGIISNPFLEHAFRTMSYTITVTINGDGTWSYEQDTILVIPGQKEPFHHTDRNTLRKIAEPTPNPTARAAAAGPNATEL